MRVDNPEEVRAEPEIVKIEVDKQLFVRNLLEDFTLSIIKRERD
jgi:hypothetical protein